MYFLTITTLKFHHGTLVVDAVITRAVLLHTRGITNTMLLPLVCRNKTVYYTTFTCTYILWWNNYRYFTIILKILVQNWYDIQYCLPLTGAPSSLPTLKSSKVQKDCACAKYTSSPVTRCIQQTHIVRQLWYWHMTHALIVPRNIFNTFENTHIITESYQ